MQTCVEMNQIIAAQQIIQSFFVNIHTLPLNTINALAI